MDDTNSVLLKAKTRGSGKLVAYGNRIETTKRRWLTLGLTKKRKLTITLLSCIRI